MNVGGSLRIVEIDSLVEQHSMIAYSISPTSFALQGCLTLADRVPVVLKHNLAMVRVLIKSVSFQKSTFLECAKEKEKNNNTQSNIYLHVLECARTEFSDVTGI